MLEQTLKQTQDRFNMSEVTRTDVAQSSSRMTFVGRESPVRRADVDAGDVLVALRDRVQHRRVVAEARLQILAGKITADRGPAISHGIDQQQNADGRPLVDKQSVP